MPARRRGGDRVFRRGRLEIVGCRQRAAAEREAAGFAIAVPLAVSAVGGRRRVSPRVPAGRTGTAGATARSGWFYVAMVAPAFIVSPGILQKVYGARDERAVRIGVGVNALRAAALRARSGGARHDRARAASRAADATDLALPMLFRTTCRSGSARSAWRRSFPRRSAPPTRCCSCWRRRSRRISTSDSSIPAATDAQVLRCARGAAVAGGGARRRRRGRRRGRRRRPRHLLHAARRQPLRARSSRACITRGRARSAALAAIAGGVGDGGRRASSARRRAAGFFHGLTPPMWGIALAAVAYMIARQ